METTYQPAAAPTPAAKILLLASGYYEQESDVYYHLLGGGYEVDVAPGSLIKSTTDLSPYFLVIVTGFDTSLSSTGVERIEASAVPVLIMEYWDFWYSYEFGLLQWESGDYYGTSTVQVIDGTHPITEGFAPSIQVYDPSYTLYGAYIPSLETGVEPLIYSLPTANEAAVIVDEARRIAATGIYDTTRYTATAWELFDRMIGWLQPFTAEEEWTATVTAGTPLFSRIAAHSSGDLLAVAGHRVFRVEEDGAVALLWDGVDSSTISLNSSGENFATYESGVVTIRDRFGAFIGSYSGASSYLRLVPGSSLAFSPSTSQMTDEGGIIDSARFFSPSGTLFSSFPAQGMRISRVTSTALYHTNAQEFVKTSLGGVEAWRVPSIVRMFEVADDADRVIVNSGWEQWRILHYENGSLVSDVDVGGSVWNIAISPDGKYSAATTKDTLHIFVNGSLVRSVALPTIYAISLDVSNEGEFGVGGASAGHIPRVMVFSQGGTLLWEDVGDAPDDNGWRPEVDFVNQENGMIVRTGEGLTYFAIDRSN